MNDFFDWLPMLLFVLVLLGCVIYMERREAKLLVRIGKPRLEVVRDQPADISPAVHKTPAFYRRRS